MWQSKLIRKRISMLLLQKGMQKSVLILLMVMLGRVYGLFQVFIGILSFLDNLFLFACLIRYLGKKIVWLILWQSLQPRVVQVLFVIVTLSLLLFKMHGLEIFSCFKLTMLLNQQKKKKKNYEIVEYYNIQFVYLYTTLRKSTRVYGSVCLPVK